MWVAFRHDDGSWQVADDTADARRTEWVPEGGRAAKTVAAHRNGKHRRRNPTCPDCRQETP